MTGASEVAPWDEGGDKDDGPAHLSLFGGTAVPIKSTNKTGYNNELTLWQYYRCMDKQ